MKKLILLVVLLAFSVPGWGATLWVNPAGSATSPYDTKAKGLTTIRAGLQAMSGGDTLMITDGTYTGATNAIMYSYPPPDGSAGAYTIVKAETDGGVALNGQSARTMVCLNSSAYIQLEGIISHSNESGGTFGIFEIGSCNHIKALRCGAYDTAGSGDDISNAFNVNNSSYVLIEDCYSYGSASYNFIAYISQNTIFRRCVARHDKYPMYSSQSSFAVYRCSGNVLFQNCIDIDSKDTYLYQTGGNGEPVPTFAWMIRDDAGTGSKMQLTGCISLNHSGITFLSSSSMVSGSEAHFDDCVVGWNSYMGGYRDSTSGTVDFDHCLFGDVDGGSVYDATDQVTTSNGVWASGDTYTVTNSILANITGTGTYAQVNGASTYNCYYGNTGNTSSTTGGTGNITATDPFAASMLYPVRIESGSALDTAGSGGGKIGPSIIYQVGVSGTLYGETGYNTVTETALWPFPNESVIKAKMQAYTATGITGNRGFASSTAKQLNGTSDVTLSSYIWEYLGNQIPADIYGETETRALVNGSIHGSGGAK